MVSMLLRVWNLLSSFKECWVLFQQVVNLLANKHDLFFFNIKLVFGVDVDLLGVSAECLAFSAWYFTQSDVLYLLVYVTFGILFSSQLWLLRSYFLLGLTVLHVPAYYSSNNLRSPLLGLIFVCSYLFSSILSCRFQLFQQQ